jgi:hypothetical protein
LNTDSFHFHFMNVFICQMPLSTVVVTSPFIWIFVSIPSVSIVPKLKALTLNRIVVIPYSSMCDIGWRRFTRIWRRSAVVIRRRENWAGEHKQNQNDQLWSHFEQLTKTKPEFKNISPFYKLKIYYFTGSNNITFLKQVTLKKVFHFLFPKLNSCSSGYFKQFFVQVFLFKF